MPDPLGILVMAYGSPRSLADVEGYYADIRGGRPPSPEQLDELVGRYRAIGGRSPLVEITRAQAKGVGARVGCPAYVGHKHAPPFIADAVKAMAEDGIERAVGLVLAPHYSRMSVGDYARRAAAAARRIGWPGRLRVIESWHLEPRYIEWLAARVGDALGSLPQELRARATVVFSAHSLPQRILALGDPYPEQLRETAQAVAAAAGVTRWRVGWQSAGRTPEAWLGPDIVEVIEELAANGAGAVVICPCGFVADHLEVLYDVDIEARRVAEGAGIALVRTASPNDDPEFLDILASVVRGAVAAPA